MALTIEKLDGTYRIETAAMGAPHPSGYEHLITPPESRTVIDNGMSFAKHPNGFIWETSFAILDGNKVEMISTVDPSHADASAFVADEKGNLTKGMVTYRLVLNAEEQNDTLVLTGELAHAGGTTSVRLTKIP